MRVRDPFEPVMIWQSHDRKPDVGDGAPPFRHDWPELLEQCRTAVARREAAYPQLVRDGRMDSELADRDLAAWKLLAAEWHWILTGEGEAPGLHTLADRIAAAELAIERVEAELHRRPTDALFYQRQLLLGIAWNLGSGAVTPAIHNLAIHQTARLNHTWRAEQAASALRSAA